MNYNFIVQGYPNANTYRSNLPDKTCGCYNNTNGRNRICIRDDSYTDANAFKTAMTGKYAVSELLESAWTTESADPYTNPQTIDPNGSETFVDAGTRDFEMPVGNETSYAGLYPSLGLSPLGLTAQITLVDPFA